MVIEYFVEKTKQLLSGIRGKRFIRTWSLANRSQTEIIKTYFFEHILNGIKVKKEVSYNNRSQPIFFFFVELLIKKAEENKEAYEAFLEL